jgi:hypothetical protein
MSQRLTDALYRVRAVMVADRRALVELPFVLYRPLAMYKLSVIDRYITLKEVI